MEEGREFTYISSNKKEKIEYLVCIELKEIFNYSNQKAIELKKLNVLAFNYFNQSKFIKLNFYNYNETFLNSIRSRNYFILRRHFCFIKSDLGANYGDYSIYKVYLFKNSKWFIFKRKTYVLYSFEYNFLLITVINKNYLYSNCSENDSKFKCLNRCFKAKNRLSYYIYNGNESGIIYLDYEYNQTIKTSEYKCLAECKANDVNCKLTYFLTKLYNHPEFKTFKPIFLISKLGKLDKRNHY